MNNATRTRFGSAFINVRPVTGNVGNGDYRATCRLCGHVSTPANTVQSGINVCDECTDANPSARFA